MNEQNNPILEVKNLRVSYHTYAGEVKAVRGVQFSLEKGQALAIVGESGCGKSVTAKSIMGQMCIRDRVIRGSSDPYGSWKTICTCFLKANRSFPFNVWTSVPL